MNAIIILLKALFAQLTTAVNKSFEKSQRGSLVFSIYGVMANFDQTFASAISSVQNMDGQTVADKINALQRGDGLYSVSVQVDMGTYIDLNSTFTDGIGTGSTVIIKKTGSSFTIQSFTVGNKIVLVEAANDATSKANTAKSEAITAAAADATTKANATLSKSQRGTITFDIDPLSYDDPIDTFNFALSTVNVNNALISSQLPNNGDGRYVVNINFTQEFGKKFANDIGHGSAIIVIKNGTNYTIESFTKTGFNPILIEANAIATDLALAAKNQAITAAASDATAKANSAKSQAITAAASDATTKANTAESNANAYTDTAVNDGVAAANSYTNDAVGQATQALETFAIDKALAAKVAAIGVASSDATAKANVAQTTAIAQAGVLATEALTMATQAAAEDATAKADAAVDTANLYTDAEIAKLQQYASIGIKSFKTFEGLVDTIFDFDGNIVSRTIANLPSYVAFGIPTTETGAHIINVTGVNADGFIVDDNEFTLTVPTGVDANGNATTTNIVVSTNDKLIVELYKLADGSFFMKYVQKYDDRLMEVVKQLIVKIDSQVSESELLSAITDVKAYVDAQINAELV